MEKFNKFAEALIITTVPAKSSDAVGPAEETDKPKDMFSSTVDAFSQGVEGGEEGEGEEGVQTDDDVGEFGEEQSEGECCVNEQEDGSIEVNLGAGSYISISPEVAAKLRDHFTGAGVEESEEGGEEESEEGESEEVETEDNGEGEESEESEESEEGEEEEKKDDVFESKKMTFKKGKKKVKGNKKTDFLE